MHNYNTVNSKTDAKVIIFDINMCLIHFATFCNSLVLLEQTSLPC